jgi:hypothetical protein
VHTRTAGHEDLTSPASNIHYTRLNREKLFCGPATRRIQPNLFQKSSNY